MRHGDRCLADFCLDFTIWEIWSILHRFCSIRWQHHSIAYFTVCRYCFPSGVCLQLDIATAPGSSDHSGIKDSAGTTAANFCQFVTTTTVRPAEKRYHQWKYYSASCELNDVISLNTYILKKKRLFIPAFFLICMCKFYADALRGQR